MEELADKLRYAYDNAPKRGQLAAVQLFAIRNAEALGNLRTTDLNALAAKAGIGMLYGGEMRLALQMASLVSLEFMCAKEHAPVPQKRRTKGFDEGELASLIGELHALCERTPEGERTVAFYIFGLKHAERIQGGNLSKLVAESGFHNSIYFAIRKGRKLAGSLTISRS